MRIRAGIVGFGMGNIASLKNALESIGVDVFVMENPRGLKEATHVLLPGVGAFPQGMENLKKFGFDEGLRRMILEEKRPFLGICLGMQLLATEGEEHSLCRGLDFIPGRVTKLEIDLPLPHVGWNDTAVVRPNDLLGSAGGCFYFVHSYHFEPTDPAHQIHSCVYGHPFVAGVQKDNIFGVQYHPEKSHAAGLDILRRFIEIPPC